MSENTEQLSEQMSKFQKIWMETFTGMAQNAFTFSPDSAPPEILRQMRSGIFQALAKSWDEYLRSPEFGEAMKRWMDSAVYYRKMTNDLLTRTHHETQNVAHQDIDAMLVAVRHLEKRLLDRIEEMEERIQQLTRTKGTAHGKEAVAAETASFNGAQRPSRARVPRKQAKRNKPGSAAPAKS